jgi:hypothetical protein
MKIRLSGSVVPAFFASSLLACSSVPVENESEVASAASAITTTCPTSGATDAQQRAAADLAFNLMRLAAKQGGATTPCYANTILAPHRYAVRSSGTGIEFRSSDPLLTRKNAAGQSCVTDEMRALLAVAQADTDLAKFLSDGQKQAYKTNGQWFPSVSAVQALATFKAPGPLSTTVADIDAIGSHSVVVSSNAWCNSDKVLMTETVKTAQGFSPLRKRAITNPAGTNPTGGDPNNWFKNPYPYGMGFTGWIDNPWSPFLGTSSNPYLIVSVNGAQVTWDSYNWAPNYNCAQTACTGYLEFGPAAYSLPADYRTTSDGLGTQTSPYTIVGSQYAAADHQCQYATLTTSGVAVLGRFATAVSATVGSTTVTRYKYAPLASIPAGACP